MENSDNTVTRRNMVKLCGLGAAGLALSGLTMAGCSDESTFDGEKGFLPLGSVVKIDGFDQDRDCKLMIVARRPLVTNNEGKYAMSNNGETTEPFDYAGLAWPIGPVSDLMQDHLFDEAFLFDNADITEVCFEGYRDEQEEAAEASLEAARGSNTLGPVILSDQFTEIFDGAIEEDDNE